MAIINNLTDAWNSAGTAFTAIKMSVTNTASAAGSKVIDLIVDGASKFSVDKTGVVIGANLSGTNTGDQTNIAGNAATVTTNANLTGPVTSTGNATAIAAGAITNTMLANAAVATLSGTNTGDNATNSQYSGLVSATWAAPGTIGATTPNTGAFTTLSTTGAATVNNLTLSGNISSPAWTTSGLRLKGVPATLTDTTSLGTVPAAYTDSLGGNTIAASSATTFTNYFSGYFKEAVAGANVTLTNKWALGAMSFSAGVTGQFTVNNAGVVAAPNLSGTNTGDQTSVTGNAATVTTNANLTGDVTSVGNATTLTNAPVIAKVLTGFTSGAGIVAATDSILAAIQKINGNDALKAPLASPTFSGTVGLPAGQAVNGVTLTNAGLASNFLTAAGTYVAAGGGGSPGGATTQVQINDAGAFYGESNFTYNKTTKVLKVDNGIQFANLSASIKDYFYALLMQTANDSNVPNRAVMIGRSSYDCTTLFGADSEQFRFSAFANASVGIATHISDYPVRSLSLSAQNAVASATTNLIGGALNVVAGNGASSSAGAASGGAVNVVGGIGYGSGAAGAVNLAYTGSAAQGTVKVWAKMTMDAPIVLKSYTVATLPSAATSGAGAQAYVTDALTPAYNTTVTGGGTAKIITTSDGTNWKT